MLDFLRFFSFTLWLVPLVDSIPHYQHLRVVPQSPRGWKTTYDALAYIWGKSLSPRFLLFELENHSNSLNTAKWNWCWPFFADYYIKIRRHETHLAVLFEIIKPQAASNEAHRIVEASQLKRDHGITRTTGVNRTQLPLQGGLYSG